MSLYEHIEASATFIKKQIKAIPEIGIILGSGLGGLIDIVETSTEINYSDIPYFPVSTVEGHVGKLVFGRLGNKNIVMMAGRFHFYEGYSMEQVTFPVRVMKALGADKLFVSNAAGGMNPAFTIGDLMLIKDHINLFSEHPLRGHNDERLGVRFPDMSQPYDRTMLSIARDIANEQSLNVHAGVYAGLSGPTFETHAEYKWLHIIGADAVGMSTVPEVIVAVHSKMRVFAASVITDLGLNESPVKITHEEVLEAANAAAPKLATLVAEMAKRI